VSEEALLRRLREISGVARGTGGPGIRLSPGTAPPSPRSDDADLLRVLASKIGVDEASIERCFDSREAYEWCLALLGEGYQPPPHPFPPELSNLLLRLAGEGKIEAGRLRALGLDKLMPRFILGGLARRFAAERPFTDRREAEEELRRASEIFRKVERAVPLEELRERLKAIAERLRPEDPAGATRVLESALKGEVRAEQAVEELMGARREAGGEEEGRRLAVARAETPGAQQGVVGARAERPRGG